MIERIKILVFKIWQKYVLRSNLFELYNTYKTSQFYDEEKVNSLQLNYLKDLLNFAKKNVDYYNNLIPSDIEVLSQDELIEVLKSLPIINKEIINTNKKSFISRNAESKKVYNNSTSGSTGSNFHFLSYRTRHGQALQIRQDEWLGKKLFDKEVKIWGAPFDVKRSQKVIPWLKSIFKRTIVLSGYQLSDSRIDEYIGIIKSFKPKILHSYPSILYQLALYVEASNIKMTPFVIKSAGEKLHQFQREKIETIFKTKVFDFYGARDIPMIAQECQEHSGLHVIMENVYLEVVDENDNPIEEGEGDLVLTHLHNYAMPFIRYRIGDRASISKRKCKCGRNLQMIDEIIGRSFDIIQFPNGNRVGGTFWTFVMKSVPGINEFQVIKESDNFIKILFTKTNDVDSINTSKLTANISEFAGKNLKIEFLRVDEIPTLKNGKIQFVVDKTRNV